MTHEDQRTDVLDFPGAAALQRAGRTGPLDPAVQARAHSVVLGAIAADTADTAPAAFVKPRFGRSRLFALAAAVAAIAVGAAILPVTDMSGSGPAASASASEVFSAMAGHITITERYRALTLSDAYWKTRVETWAEGGKSRTDTRYLDRDSVTVRTADGRVVTKEIPGGASWPVGNSPVTWDGLEDLPTEPDTLRRVLSAGSKGADDAAEQTVQQVGQLLTDAPVSPELRAALLHVLAKTPGATVKEGVEDAKGRAGTQISWKWAKPFAEQNAKDRGFHPAPYVDNPEGAKPEPTAVLRPNWIVSPSDGRLLEVNLEPDDDAGHIVQRETYLSAGPAKTTG